MSQPLPSDLREAAPREAAGGEGAAGESASAAGAQGPHGTDFERPLAIVGLGYTGLPLASAFVSAGRSVLGYDRDRPRLELLRRGQSPLPHLDPAAWNEGPRRARLWLPEAQAELHSAEAVFLCLPTPLGPGDRPDLSALEAAARELAPRLAPEQLVVLTSTSFPGTLRRHLSAWLTHGGARPRLAYSPEREDPGSGRPARTVPRLVAGLDPGAREQAAAILRQAIDEVIEVDSPELAEAAKLFENAFRAVNIALANELKRIVLPLGLDPHAVIAAAATKPFGFLPFSPGPGAGGHCIPVDPHYLQHTARAADGESGLIAAALEINRAMPGRVLARLAEALRLEGRTLRGSAVLLIGLAYKPGVADLREAPGLELLEQLEAAGVQVEYHDPYLPVLGPDGGRYEGRQSVALEPLGRHAAVLIVTDHPGIPWGRIWREARLIVDTRGVLREHHGDPRYWPA
jgi:UDP-N-acetyl-D-glucosamine dehydrogenase